MVTLSFLPTVGGLEWKVHYLATEYRKQGHDVTVFALRQNLLNPPTLPITPTYNLVWCGYQMRGMSRLGLSSLLFVNRILKSHHQKPFDVLHCHTVLEPTLYGIRARKKTGIPVVTTTCGGDVQVFPEFNYGARLSKRYDKLVRYVVKNTNVIGSISRDIRRHLEEIGTNADIVDIPNGVDLEAFTSNTFNDKRELLNIPKDSIIILSLGRNHHKKNYADGIKAFSKLAQKYDDIYYVIVGRETDKLHDLTIKLDIQNKVILVNQIPMSEVSDYLRTADIFFNPSLVEGFAQVNAQAIACGLPCVINDSPGNIDALDYGGCIATKTNDINSFTECLEKVYSDKALRKSLAAKSSKEKIKLSWETIATTYLDIFDRLQG
jgi:teichuronic acid biosynthesis glycosyltransferase TuaC